MIGAFIALTSCDSDGPDNNTSGTGTAEALDIPLTGDVLNLTSNNINTQYNTLTFTNGIASDEIGLDTFSYTRAGTFGFNLEPNIAAGFSDAQIFSDVVANLLGSSASLANEFREIVNNRNGALFTQAEIDRLIIILNTSGTNIIDNGNGNLSSMTTSSLAFRVTSTLNDQLTGSQGGTFSADARVSPVLFTAPTDTQLQLFRFLQPDAQIPFLSDQVDISENIDEGTWILQLSL